MYGGDLLRFSIGVREDDGWASSLCLVLVADCGYEAGRAGGCNWVLGTPREAVNCVGPEGKGGRRYYDEGGHTALIVETTEGWSGMRRLRDGESDV